LLFLPMKLSGAKKFLYTLSNLAHRKISLWSANVHVNAGVSYWK
jgi:hypothetical protein